MSCDIENGEEVALCGQPLDQGKYRNVQLIIHHDEPDGFYKLKVIHRNPGRGPQFTGEVKFLPVKIVPVGDEIYDYKDEQQGESVARNWGDIYFEGSKIDV